MNSPLDFQSIIMTLQDFWAEQGCLIWQPYYSQVGAGTMNPATFLRVLGPEPWRVAYVEPSIRPDDGRYGENPNRLQMHYQFQVILKPDPGNPQELYLQSLEALGIDQRLHDIRFVEDNWKQPALGAWGLGWEVWLDGQEITQFTYFQQAGGVSLDPVSVELTYGLERIAIALQGIDSFLDIRWNPGFTDGEINLSAEQEHSKYYFEIADVQNLRKMFELYAAEATACINQELVLPAYDYLLKCSHTFNILDTRGAVGVTERQTYFGSMRELARRVSEVYLEQRRALGFPWIEKEQKLILNSGDLYQEVDKFGASTGSEMRQSAPFLLEIGTEELPVDDLESGIRQLKEALTPYFQKLRLSHGEIKVLGTPRRLVVFVEQLAPAQENQVQVIKGPPADRAFNPDGTPTKAAEGFAKSKGVALDEIEVRSIDGGQYAVAILQEQGRRTVDVLQDSLPELIASLHFDQSMRWNSTNVAFSRPIRWLLIMFGHQFIPCEYAGVRSGNFTCGLRFHEPIRLPVKSAQEYFDVVKSQGILLDPEQRRRSIHSQIVNLISKINGRLSEDADFIEEVGNLVEAPNALLGSFAETHLNLPHEVLISVMKKHQRYFPIFRTDPNGSDSLLPHFVIIRNGDGHGNNLVVSGNEHVLRARFADAEFFVREDLKKPLESYLPRLESLTFQVSLGSMLEKSHRIKALAADLATMLGATEDEAQITRRAAELCKADLATQMVIEMTSLQGLMGRYYAIESGEPVAVAEAVFEHYLPRFAGDLIPANLPGLIVGLADRLDSLCGLFAVGHAPTGNKDPFGLRRTALGLVQNLTAWEIDIDLAGALETAAKYLPVEASAEIRESVFLFIVERLRHYLMSQGCRYDVVDAVIAAQGNHPVRTMHAVKKLDEWVEREDWREILPAFARCVRITRDFKERFAVDKSSFTEPAEIKLFEVINNAEKQKRSPGAVDDFLNTFTPLIPVINEFFDEVLVMTDDAGTRMNRLGLLQRIVALADGVADMSFLEGF